MHPTLPTRTHTCFSRSFEAANQGWTQEPLLQVNNPMFKLSYCVNLNSTTSNTLAQLCMPSAGLLMPHHGQATTAGLGTGPTDGTACEPQKAQPCISNNFTAQTQPSRNEYSAYLKPFFSPVYRWTLNAMSNSARGLPSCPYTKKHQWRPPECASTLQQECWTAYTHSARQVK